jgi:hypothetical protein
MVAAGRILEIVQIVTLSLVKITTKLYLKVGVISLPCGRHLMAIFLAIFLAYFGKLALEKYQLIARL